MKISTDTIERYLNIYIDDAIDDKNDELDQSYSSKLIYHMIELSYTPYHTYLYLYILLFYRKQNFIYEIS